MLFKLNHQIMENMSKEINYHGKNFINILNKNNKINYGLIYKNKVKKLVKIFYQLQEIN